MNQSMDIKHTIECTSNYYVNKAKNGAVNQDVDTEHFSYSYYFFTKQYIISQDIKYLTK